MTARPARPRSTTARFAAGVAALLLAGGLGACSSDGDEGADPTTTVAEEATTTTVADDPAVDGSDDTATGDEGDGNDDAPTSEPVDPADLDEAGYVEALAAGFEAYGPEATRTCLAEAWVDELGYDELVASGADPAAVAGGDDEAIDLLDVDEDQATALFDAFAGCDVDLLDLVASTGPRGEATPEERACVEDLITEDDLRASFLSEFSDDEDPSDDVFEQVNDCFQV